MQTLSQLEAGQYQGTRQLKLSCDLTEVPAQILDLADSLEVLDLSGNHLAHLPEWFAQLKKLKIAFFSNNDFTVFPAVMGQCPELEMIGFKACKLETVPENAIPVTTRWLILTDNKIEALPNSLGNCAQLQKLMLAGNKLKTLPATLANCQNLELLRISANQLTHLPDWLFSLPRLSWLAFSGNPFSFQPATVSEIPVIPWADLTLEQSLGEGASGVIYRARWQNPAQPETQMVAVKLFKGNITSDGLPQDEIQACLAAGQHPHLVRALAKISGHPEQKQGVVFDLLPDGYRPLGNPPSLESCTRDTFPASTSFSTQDILRIVSGVASVTAHLHAQGILHGDLYAHNTLVNAENHALLSDFGAATLFDPENQVQAAALQRLEAGAFGCLLEDLMAFVLPDAKAQNQIIALKNLTQECQRPSVQTRPDFLAIVAELERITTL